MKLTEAQRRVLETVHEVGGLHRYQTSLWNWYRKLSEGYVVKVCGNATIAALKQKGLLADAGFDNVTITDLGRAALAQQEPKV